MNRDRWSEIDRLLEAALERPASERAAYLRAVTGDDEELRREVESLLEHDDTTFLEQSAAAEATAIMSRSDRVVGTTIGRFTVVGRAGEGGMGEVYRGFDAQLSRPVAIKVMGRDVREVPELLRRFRQEAIAASALNHPNIVTVYDSGEIDGRPYIVTEFVEGETLRARMRRGAMPLDEVLDVGIQVARALDAAHRAGIVHRDIKPENILIRPDGIAKVVDFGIAKYMERPDADRSVSATVPGALLGTVPYMSPEQARGVAVDHRTDIWSVGVILYEALTGRRPFEGETSTDRLAAILQREPEPVGELRQDIPRELERIVAATLAKNVAERMQTAGELVRALQEVRGGTGERTGAALPQGRRRVWLAATAFALVALLAGAAAWIHSRRDAGEPIASLAVLPLENAGGGADTEYLSDGLTDNLINSLSRLPDLKVMSRNSVFHYKGRQPDLRAVGDALGVRGVLTGRVARRGDAISVSVELTDLRDNRHVWGEQYNRKAADIVGLQEEISRDVASQLHLTLSADQQQRLARPDTESAKAYDLYLRGRYYWFKSSPADFQKSREFFQRAIDADPTYALAYAGLADFYGFGAATGLLPPNEAWPKAVAAAAKALQLDPRLAEAHHTVGGQQLYWHRDYAAGEASLRRAMQLNPNYAEAFSHYGSWLAARGRFDEAIEHRKKALSLDPLSLRYHRLTASMYYYARRYDEAIEWSAKALELDPNDAPAHEILASAQAQSGAHGDAIESWQRALVLAGAEPAAEFVRRKYEAGGYGEAIRALGEARLGALQERAGRGEYVPAMSFVRAYVHLGDHENALEWLERAARERNRLIFDANVDPHFDALRADPRFARAMQTLGFTGPRQRPRRES